MIRLRGRAWAWYDDAMIKTNRSATALAALNAIIALTPDTDDNLLITRTLLIHNDLDACRMLHDDADLSDADTISRLLRIIADDRELLTTLLLDYSLCPLHTIDYAICFDDDNDECLHIRIIHPAHDS
jgi:hypothetical protein